MKHRYIVTTYVDATSPQEAVRLAKKTNPLEVRLDNDIWKERGYALTEEDKKQLGFKDH
jgi:hypothetical protein